MNGGGSGYPCGGNDEYAPGQVATCPYNSRETAYSSLHASSYFARCSFGSGEAKYDIPTKSTVFTSRPKKPGNVPSR